MYKFQLIVLSAVLAVASAGGPAAYSIATSPGDYSSVGYTQESTHKGYAGQNVISSFSKAVDSPHSSVRVSNSRVTNDALYSHSIAAPAYSYASATPVVAKTAYAAPAYGYAAAPVPAYGYAKAAYAAPAYSSAPSVSYSSISTPVVAKTAYAAPAYGYAKTAYAAAPAYSYAPAAPLVAKTAYAAPAYSYAPAAHPVVTKTAYAAAAPAYGYAAAPVVHTTFEGIGAHYAW